MVRATVRPPRVSGTPSANGPWSFDLLYILIAACAAAGGLMGIRSSKFAPLAALAVVANDGRSTSGAVDGFGALRADALQQLPQGPAALGNWVSGSPARCARDRDVQLRQSDARPCAGVSGCAGEFAQWCGPAGRGGVALNGANQTAAHPTSGFDARRDQLQLIGNLVRDPSFAAMASWNYSRDVVLAFSVAGSAPNCRCKPSYAGIAVCQRGSGRDSHGTGLRPCGAILCQCVA